MEKEKKKMNKVYWAETDPDYGCVYIAAPNIREAKQTALCTWVADHMERYIDLKVKWCKSTPKTEYEGELDIFQINELGLTWFDCPYCGKEDFNIISSDECYCKSCKQTFDIPYMP